MTRSVRSVRPSEGPYPAPAYGSFGPDVGGSRGAMLRSPGRAVGVRMAANRREGMAGVMSTRFHPRVIVGVDRSLHGLAALRFAAAEAVRRGAPLYAVRVQSDLFPPTDYREIDAAFAEALGGFPQGVEVHKELAVPPVAAALARRAGDERDLLVVGESGRGIWHTVLFGSVARACLRRAGCPVVAVPAPEMARTVWRGVARWRRGSADVWQRFEDEQPSLRG